MLLLAGCSSDSYESDNTSTSATPTIATIPTPTPGPSRSVSLQSLHMLNAKTGWAITQDDHILHTLDGVAHWADVTPGSGTADLVDASLQASYFLDANNGWIVFSQSQKLTIWHTADGGGLWYPMPLVGSVQQVVSLQFLDANNGWLLLGSGGTSTATNEAVQLFSTIDGGQTWLPVDSADAQTKDVAQHLPFSGVKTGVTFADSLHGWLTGCFPATGSQPLSLYISSNGSASWQVQKLEVATSKGISSSARWCSSSPTFFDTSTAVMPVSVSGSQSAVSLYTTTDGGKAWSSSPLNTAISTTIDFVNARTGWAIGAGKQPKSVYATTDGGRHWQELTLPTKGRAVDALDFVSATTGWLLISDAHGLDTLYQTTDGGKTWHALSPTATSSLS